MPADPLKRRKGGNPPFVADDEQRRMVALLASAGFTQKVISARLGISVDTLQRHLKAEFDEGHDYANSAVGETLLKEALKGDVKAIDSWLDRRGGPDWRKRTAAELSGPNGEAMKFEGTVSNAAEDFTRLLLSLAARAREKSITDCTGS